MSKISVDCPKMIDAIGQMRKSASAIEVIVERAKNVRLNLNSNWQTGAQASCSRNIVQIEKRILDEAAQMESLAAALEAVVEYYELVDTSIIANNCGHDDLWGLSPIKKMKFDAFWIRFRQLLVTWGIIKTTVPVETPKEEPPTDLPPAKVEGQKVSLAQEEAQDLLMQEQIANLLSETRFSEKTWQTASTEERKSILNEYIQNVAGIMGLSMGSIKFFYAESQNGYYTSGQYSHSSRTVSINEWVIENKSNSYSLMKTVVHEMRHAYQHAACDNPEQFIVSEETIQKWQDSFDNYKSQSGFMSTGMNASDAFKAYRNQAVEVDARSFAKQS